MSAINNQFFVRKQKNGIESGDFHPSKYEFKSEKAQKK